MAQPPQRVVLFAPDFFADAFGHQAGFDTLQLWRDGQIRPIVHRVLLVRYFRIFGRLGFTERLIRWWGWWFSLPERTIPVEAEFQPAISARELCETLARAAGAQCVICSSSSAAKPIEVQAANDVPWLTAEQFVRSLRHPNAGENG